MSGTSIDRWTPVAIAVRHDRGRIWNDLPEAPMTLAEANHAYSEGRLLKATQLRGGQWCVVVKAKKEQR